MGTAAKVERGEAGTSADCLPGNPGGLNPPPQTGDPARTHARTHGGSRSLRQAVEGRGDGMEGGVLGLLPALGPYQGSSNLGSD